MVTKLIQHGNGYALLLDQDTIQSISATLDTPLDVSKHGEVLVVRSASEGIGDAELDEILEGVNRDYGTVLRKLAE